jgi:hypothetical protein
MKNTKQIAIVRLLLLLGVSAGVSSAAAQSLGDYARTAKKNKPETTAATRHYDNDNLPTNETLSVVGPSPDAKSAPGAKTGAVDPAAAAAEQKKTADEWKQKLDTQKQKIDALNHEIDLEQREYRLRQAAFYGDAGARLRDTAQWQKDETQYKSDVDGKQKALQSAQEEFSDLQEDARKAGIREKEESTDNNDKK